MSPRKEPFYLDERIAMTARVPIQAKWVEGERLTAGLAGQTIEIPIRGTLRNPKIDDSVLSSLTQKAIRGAADNFLQNELERQLQKLFK